MLLEALRSIDGSQAAASQMSELMRALYPLPRSITGNGVRATLDHVAAWAPLERHEVASGTPVYDWTVPPEWNVREAWIADAASGRRLVDLRDHNLHLVGYSVPVRATLSRAELEPHLHSLPAQPDRIPYRTSYWRPTWGFCLRHAQRIALGEGPFEVVVDTTLAPGHLSYGECVVPGRSDEESTDEALVFTHTCHPSLANDNLSGIVVAAALARALGAERPRLTWRIVFAPGTIGSLVWLSRNEARLPRLRAGLVIGLLGDAAALSYKPSRRGDTLVDRVARLVVPAHGGRELDYEPYGYDERQFCSPGFDLPVGRLTRSPNGAYDEYHSSADDLALVQTAQLAASLRALAEMVGAIDANRCWLNTHGRGEPQLGRRGLYRTTGGSAPGRFENALFWLLNQSDGRRDLVDIATRSKLPLAVLDEAAHALAAAGLLAPLPPTHPVKIETPS